MMQFKLAKAMEACGGKFHGDGALLEKDVRGVAIDHRGLEQDFLFVPIKGERFDGHDFIQPAYEAGALCCLTEKPLETEQPHIIVENTERAFQDIAGYYKSLFGVRTFGITGSAGKTTTKEIVATVLEQGYHVLKTEGNLNNQTGVPQMLLRLEPGHEVAVIEMGMNHFGEIGRLAEITRPDHCILTNIGDAHIEHLGSREGILRAKCEMLEYMQDGGKIFVNGDDELLSALQDERSNIVTYGIGEKNDIRAVHLRDLGLDGTAFTVQYGQDSFGVTVPSPGRHMVINALAAVAAGLEMELDAEQIAAGIADYVPVGGRMRIHRQERLTILDDVYNANPQSMAAALETLRLADGRRVCILGDMLELGGESARYHHEAGEKAARCAQLALFVGKMAKEMCRGAHSTGCEVHHFDTQEELQAMLPALIHAGDTVLVKASRGMKLEQTVERLQKLYE